MNKARVATILGTRPETIKLAPVIRALETRQRLAAVNLCTGQQADLLDEFLVHFELGCTARFDVLQPGQPPARLLSRLLAALEPALAELAPACVVVQGDTLSALAGATAAWLQGVPVVHVEAGLRTGNPASPFPEEGSRQMIARLATLHCAATAGNRDNLLAEGIAPAAVQITGNPIVDVLNEWCRSPPRAPRAEALLEAMGPRRPVLLTMHRRENLGPRLAQYVAVIARWLGGRPDLALVLPRHPNPGVEAALAPLRAMPSQVIICEPLGYADFLTLMQAATLVLSDSGGVQEEVCSLGRPLFILRDTTERPEALAVPGVSLAPDATTLEALLHAPPAAAGAQASNPFGDGAAGPRIAAAIDALVSGPGA